MVDYTGAAAYAALTAAARECLHFLDRAAAHRSQRAGRTCR
jgi:hypothetical protein